MSDDTSRFFLIVNTFNGPFPNLFPIDDGSYFPVEPVSGLCNTHLLNEHEPSPVNMSDLSIFSFFLRLLISLRIIAAGPPRCGKLGIGAKSSVRNQRPPYK
jgi:hypothetical protein